MKRKELTKTFMRISIWKNPLFYMVYTKIFQRCKGERLCEVIPDHKTCILRIQEAGTYPRVYQHFQHCLVW